MINLIFSKKYLRRKLILITCFLTILLHLYSRSIRPVKYKDEKKVPHQIILTKSELKRWPRITYTIPVLQDDSSDILNIQNDLFIIDLENSRDRNNVINPPLCLDEKKIDVDTLEKCNYAYDLLNCMFYIPFIQELKEKGIITYLVEHIFGEAVSFLLKICTQTSNIIGKLSESVSGNYNSACEMSTSLYNKGSKFCKDKWILISKLFSKKSQVPENASENNFIEKAGFGVILNNLWIQFKNIFSLPKNTFQDSQENPLESASENIQENEVGVLRITEEIRNNNQNTNKNAIVKRSWFSSFKIWGCDSKNYITASINNLYNNYIISKDQTTPKNQNIIERNNLTEPNNFLMLENITEDAIENVNHNSNGDHNINKNINEDITEKASENLSENVVENLSENVVEKIADNLTENVVENLTENVVENDRNLESSENYVSCENTESNEDFESCESNNVNNIENVNINENVFEKPIVKGLFSRAVIFLKNKIVNLFSKNNLKSKEEVLKPIIIKSNEDSNINLQDLRNSNTTQD